MGKGGVARREDFNFQRMQYKELWDNAEEC
jgi:hypothetical protein